MSTSSEPQEGLQDQIDELSRRVDAADADRRSLSDRADAAAAQADLDRKMIIDLQAAGVVGEQHARDLEAALRSSRIIGAAIGILMASRKVNDDQAFAILRQASQDQNRKLRELAEEIVQAACPDGPPEN